MDDISRWRVRKHPIGWEPGTWTGYRNRWWHQHFQPPSTHRVVSRVQRCHHWFIRSPSLSLCAFPAFCPFCWSARECNYNWIFIFVLSCGTEHTGTTQYHQLQCVAFHSAVTVFEKFPFSQVLVPVRLASIHAFVGYVVCLRERGGFRKFFFFRTYNCRMKCITL